MHSVGGFLEQMPVLGIHIPGIRTKVSRRLALKLTDAAKDIDASKSSDSPYSTTTADNDNNKGSMTIYIDDLIEVIQNEIMYASRQGSNYTFTQRARRMLRKAAVVAIKGSLHNLFDAWLEGMNNMEDSKTGKEPTECLSALAMPGTRRSTAVLTRRLIFKEETPQAENNPPGIPLITPPVDLTDDVEADESDVDIVLTELKEQSLLQNLLFKNVMDKQQRLLVLEHKNGRKLCVFIPPDCQSIKAFLDEAKRSRWINDMLYTEVQRQGMLMYLAKTNPDDYLKIALKKKLRVTSEVLSTPQTMALGRLTGIKNTQMAKFRSFLKHVGNAELKWAKAELSRIDRDVGLHSIVPSATCDTYALEWSTTSAKGVEKKAPEHCSFWNCDMLVEVASEIDMLCHGMFLDKLDMTAVPSLDCGAPGFPDKPGVVVLFGGDHGAGNCPCSMKLNFSSPQQRKERGKLNWRCPTIQIASIECTKDSFELLSNTIMPRIKAQLIDL